MNELKFNSQVCTTKEQSEQLLALGLKPETADMSHQYIEAEWSWFILPCNWANCTMSKDTIPAWSLHRLIELRFAGDNMGLGVYNIHNRNFGNCYEILISVIEYLIKIGEFNKQYLKQ